MSSNGQLTFSFTQAENVTASPSMSARRQLDRIDRPARALGAKRAALQLRRQTRTVLADSAKTMPAGTGASLTLVSNHARVSFAMRATAFGLLIERSQRRNPGTRLVQAMVFADQPTFDRWCDSEPMRFEDPGLYDHLVRAGHHVLGDSK